MNCKEISLTRKLQWNMVYNMSLVRFLFLEYPTKLESKSSTWFILQIGSVFKIFISEIFTRPIQECTICLTCVSFPLFIFTDPESEIHPMILWSIEPDSTNETVGSFFEDIVLENLSSLHLLYTTHNKLQFFLITRKNWCYPEILVC